MRYPRTAIHTSFLAIMLLVGPQNASASEAAEAKKLNAHLETLKHFVQDPTWEGLTKQLNGSEERTSERDAADGTREERGYIPLLMSSGDERVVTSKFFLQGAGTANKIAYVVAGLGWRIGEKHETKGNAQLRSGKQTKKKKAVWDDDKRVAVQALRDHAEHFKAAGFDVLSVKDETMPGWIQVQYRLRHKKREFTIRIEHEGSGMDFDFETSRGGYVHFICCLQPQDCAR